MNITDITAVAGISVTVLLGLTGMLKYVLSRIDKNIDKIVDEIGTLRTSLNGHIVQNNSIHADLSARLIVVENRLSQGDTGNGVSR